MPTGSRCRSASGTDCSSPRLPAGLPGATLAADEMAPVREALERFLAAHAPYPAVVVDRRWNLVLANEPVALLTEGVAPELLEPPANALRATLHPDGMAPRIVNFAEWSGHLLHRLRRQVELTADENLARLFDELAGYPNVDLEPPAAQAPAAIIVPLRLRRADVELSFFSTVTTFAHAGRGDARGARARGLLPRRPRDRSAALRVGEYPRRAPSHERQFGMLAVWLVIAAGALLTLGWLLGASSVAVIGAVGFVTAVAWFGVTTLRASRQQGIGFARAALQAVSAAIRFGFRFMP